MEGTFKEIEPASEAAAPEDEANSSGDVEADDSPNETTALSTVPPLPGPATYESLKNKPKQPRGERRSGRLDENGFVGQFQERMNQFRRKENDDRRQDILAEATALSPWHQRLR